jgi:Type II secretion system (T2SS), protein F
VETVFPFIAAALSIALVLGTVRAIRLNLMHRSGGPIRFNVITLLNGIENFLFILILVALLLAVPHPEMALFLVVLLVSLTINRRLRNREDSASLNRWIRFAAQTKTPLSSVISGFASVCRSLIGTRAKWFASQVHMGQPIMNAAIRSRLPMDADNFATLLKLPGPNEKNAVGISPVTSAFAINRGEDLDFDDQRYSRSLTASMEQFTYAVALIFLGWLIGICVRKLLSVSLNEMLKECLVDYRSEVTWWSIAERMALVSNILVFVLFVWLVLAMYVGWMPHWLVRCVPWFGSRAIDQWRSTVLQWVKHQTDAHLSEADALLYARNTTRIGWIRRRCKSVYNQLQQGVALPVALQRCGVISKREQIWFTSAQRNGNLSNAIRNLVDDIDRQQVYRWRRRMSWFVPAAIIFVGVYALTWSSFVYEALSYMTQHLP